MGHRTRKLNVYFVDGDHYALFGRERIQQFVNEIHFRNLFSASETVQKQVQSLQDVLDNLFSTSAVKLNIPINYI